MEKILTKYPIVKLKNLTKSDIEEILNSKVKVITKNLKYDGADCGRNGRY